MGIATSFVILSAGWNFSVNEQFQKCSIGIAVCREQGHSTWWSSFEAISRGKRRKEHPLLQNLPNKWTNKKPKHRLQFVFMTFFSFRKLLSGATSEFSWQKSHHWILTIEESTTKVQKLLSNTSESVVCRSIDNLFVFQDSSHSVFPGQKFQIVCSCKFAYSLSLQEHLIQPALCRNPSSTIKH